MTTHGFARIHSRRNLGQHLRITVDNTGKIHHLAETNDTGPLHRLRDVIRRNLVPSGFQTGGRGGAGRHLGIDVDGLHQRLVMHHTHTIKAQHIRNFMRIGKHGGGAMRDHGGGKFGGCQHAAFDMHMPVAQARDQIAPCAINHLRFRPNAMGCIHANIGKPPL